jgi:hypothetical protein
MKDALAAVAITAATVIAIIAGLTTTVLWHTLEAVKERSR